MHYVSYTQCMYNVYNNIDVYNNVERNWSGVAVQKKSYRFVVGTTLIYYCSARAANSKSQWAYLAQTLNHPQVAWCDFTNILRAH